MKNVESCVPPTVLWDLLPTMLDYTYGYAIPLCWIFHRFQNPMRVKSCTGTAFSMIALDVGNAIEIQPPFYHGLVLTIQNGGNHRHRVCHDKSSNTSNHYRCKPNGINQWYWGFSVKTTADFPWPPMVSWKHTCCGRVSWPFMATGPDRSCSNVPSAATCRAASESWNTEVEHFTSKTWWSNEIWYDLMEF